MTKRSLYSIVLGLSFIGYSWLLFNIYWDNKGNTSGFNVCLIKSTTGVPCPSCGSTRALMALGQGKLREAILINPLALLLATMMITIPVWIIYDLLNNKNSFYLFYSKAELFLRKKWMATTAICLIFLNWIWNIYKDL